MAGFEGWDARANSLRPRTRDLYRLSWSGATRRASRSALSARIFVMWPRFGSSRMRSRTRVASASYSDSDTSPLSRSARARRARARAERRSRPRRTTRSGVARRARGPPANRPGTRGVARVLGQRREAATGGGRRVVRTRRDDSREAETGGRGRHLRGRSATTGVVVTQRKRSTRRVVLSRRAENIGWLILPRSTRFYQSYINFFSLVIIDPKKFRNDTPQLRYLQRRPRLSRTSDSRRGSTDTPDDYPTRRSTSASRVSYYDALSARGACSPAPPRPGKREKQAGHRLPCRIAASQAWRARAPPRVSAPRGTHGR